MIDNRLFFNDPYPQVIALDTEFIRIKTYWPQLSLVQIHDGNHAYLIDALAEDIEPLKQILLNPSIIKVLHSARQDLEIFFYLWGELPYPIFDTQIAARFCGFGYEVGLNLLAKEFCGVELEKSAQFSAWLKRPLTEKQLKYAEQDVRYLIPIYRELAQRLQTNDNQDVFEQVQAELLKIQLYQPNPAEAWRRVKNHQQLTLGQREWLKILAAWREDEAIRQNLIRRLILPDEILLKIATRRPKTKEKVVKALTNSFGFQVNKIWDLIQKQLLTQ
jgi:ribonuclease D